MGVLVNNRILVLGRVEDIINHPGGGEDEEDDEENLQVRGADVYVFVSGAAGQGTAQDQDVDADDPGQHPSPVPTSLPCDPAGRAVQVRLTRAPCLTRCTDVVGQVGLFRLCVSGCHPAWLTGTPVGQTVTQITRVQTHLLSLLTTASGYRFNSYTLSQAAFKGRSRPGETFPQEQNQHNCHPVRVTQRSSFESTHRI